MNPAPGASCSSLPSLPGTAEELLPLVYEELRRLAAHRMAAQMPGQTLQATAKRALSFARAWLFREIKRLQA